MNKSLNGGMKFDMTKTEEDIRREFFGVNLCIC